MGDANGQERIYTQPLALLSSHIHRSEPAVLPQAAQKQAEGSYVFFQEKKKIPSFYTLIHLFFKPL